MRSKKSPISSSATFAACKLETLDGKTCTIPRAGPHAARRRTPVAAGLRQPAARCTAAIRFDAAGVGARGPGAARWLALPPALSDALQRSAAVLLNVPLTERARAWFERMQVTGTSLANLVDAFGAMNTLSGIMNTHIDPQNDVSR